MHLAQLAGVAGLIIWGYMSLLFVLAVFRRDNSLADIGWGPGFVVVAVSVLLLQADFSTRQLLVTSLIIVWGLRLSIRIFRRNWGKGEDFRYQRWRSQWRKFFLLRSYLQVFLLQGFFMWLISLPVIIVSANTGPGLNWLDFAGLAIWLTGFFFESVSDWQLDGFLADKENRGKVLDTGLWRYSRHPNYFGEVAMWWGIYLVSLSQPWGWAGVIGPVTITVLIVFVSGIPLLEKSMMKNPDYREYARKTSVLFPLPPGK